MNPAFEHVVEHPHIVDPQAELRLSNAREPFDSSSADLGRLVPEVHLDRLLDRGPNVGPKTPEIPGGLGSEDDLVAHSGYSIAIQ